MIKRVLKLITPVGLVIAAIIVAMMMVGSRQQLEASNVEQPLPQVNAIEVGLGDVPIAIVAHGNVSARHELELASEVTGRVEWVAPEFEPGEIVAAGTVLLRVDSSSYRLAVAEAKADLASAELLLADAQALKRKASVGESKLKIEAVRQRIAKAEQDLAYTEIKAPFDAVIDQQLVEFGQFINAGRTVARLLSSSTAEVSLPVTAADAGYLEEAAGTEVVLSAQMGQEQLQWQARVLRIESRVDQQTRVIPVVVEVASPYDLSVHSHRLPLGLFVKAVLSGRSVGSAVRLPNSVLQTNNTVFVLVDDTLHRRQVDIVHREGNSVIVNGGLDQGDLVVTTRLDVMFEGMKVERSDA